MKLSLIIPVYNVERYVEKCLKSIIPQLNQNKEIIIVNDGSTDNSLEIVNCLSINHDNIKVFSKDNGGLSSARNFGLIHANGEYVWFVDSDDYISDGAISFLLKEIESGYDIIKFSTVKVDENGNFQSKYDIISFKGTTQDYIIGRINKKTFLTSACWQIYKKSLLDHIKFRTDIIHEDTEIFFKLLLKANSIICVNEHLYYYVMRPCSIMNSLKNNDKKEASSNSLWIIYNEYKSLEIENIIIKNKILNFCIYLILIDCFEKNRDKSYYIEYIKKEKIYKQMTIFTLKDLVTKLILMTIPELFSSYFAVLNLTNHR